ncbi:MAG: nickel-binding protein [Actinomycetota bacterium]
MPRYVIERTYDVGEDEMPEVGRRSKRIAAEQFPQIVWEHSHVVVDDEGTLKSFCIYDAPDEQMVRRHAALLGQHVVDHVYEIGGDVTPDDFPL